MTSAPRDAGFSLLELLVVVAITSVLAIGASLPLSRVSSTSVADADALPRATVELRRLAMLSGQVHALELRARDWSGVRRDTGGGAQPVRGLAGQLSGQFAWTGPPPPQAGTPGAVRLLFLPDGRVTPARFRLVEGTAALVCIGDGGPLRCTPE